MSLSWRAGTFHINFAESYTKASAAMVAGLVDNLGIFGMHFADHRAIHLTHLATGRRIHPEPGFADLRAAAEFAERVLHLDWEHAERLDLVSRVWLQSIYQDYVLNR